MKRLAIIHKKAQAVLEIGILGSIILFIFAYLLSYLQSANNEQYVLMSNFRNALKKAHDTNAGVSYSTLENVRHVNPDRPLEGSRKILSASNYIYWAVPRVGSAGNKGKYYLVNDEEITFGDDDAIGEIHYDINEVSNNTISRIEEGDVITTIRNVDTSETATYQFIQDSDDDSGAVLQEVTQTKPIRKTRTWRTVN